MVVRVLEAGSGVDVCAEVGCVGGEVLASNCV